MRKPPSNQPDRAGTLTRVPALFSAQVSGHGTAARLSPESVFSETWPSEQIRRLGQTKPVAGPKNTDDENKVWFSWPPLVKRKTFE